MKHLSLFMSLTGVIIAFFLGYLYAQREYSISQSGEQSQIQYIDITTSTKNITIKNTPQAIHFRVNGEIMHTGSVDLK